MSRSRKHGDVEAVVTGLVWVFFGIPLLVLSMLGIYKGGKRG